MDDHAAESAAAAQGQGKVDVPAVEAAGGVVWRLEHARPVVLLVHRPRYDDWTFPKGKLDTDDADLRECALREVQEETGIEADTGARLGDVEYPVTKKGRPARKVVTYWLMQARDGTAGFRPNDEVDTVRWVDPEVARSLLTYAHDRDVLARATPLLPRLAAAGRTADASAAPQLTHLALGVSDLDASVAFYRDFCGMVPVHTRDSEGVRVAWLGDPAADAGGGRDFVLVLAEGLAPNAPLGPFAHLGFAVASRDAVDSLSERGREAGILALGATFEGPIVGYICEVFDPDGNICEFSFGQSLGRHAPPPDGS